VEDGTDIAALLAAPANARKRKMRFLSLSELAALRPPEWLIEGHLPAASFASLYGAHGSMKSFVALDWALCISHGRPWLGSHAIKPGRVVYVAGEGQHGLAKRILGWRSAKAEETPDPPIHILPQAVAMPTGELDEMIGLIAELPTPPVLIVLDTLARTFGAGDENSQKDMNAFVAACDRLRDVTGACVLVIHHSGKDAERGARGSTALPGAVDTNIYVKRSGDNVTLVNSAPHGKQKDAAEFADVCLRAQNVKFSYQGEVATTLVMMPDEAAQSAAEQPKPEPAQRLGSNQKAVLTALERAARDGQSLGFIRLLGMVKIEAPDLRKVLRKMVDAGQIVSADGQTEAWMLP
jgi:putative DNA primase/helicase